MLDLKAKLLEAGVVTEKQVEKVEAEQEKKRQKNKSKKKHKKQKASGTKGEKKPIDDSHLWQRRIRKLQNAGKSEQYDAIRGWVDKHRIDSPKRILSEEAKKFHFGKMDNKISWITIEPDVEEGLQKGDYGIIAYMSHNGLSHCIVARDLAIDVHQIRPEWLRKLEKYEFTPVIEGTPASSEEGENIKTSQEKPISPDLLPASDSQISESNS